MRIDGTNKNNFNAKQWQVTNPEQLKPQTNITTEKPENDADIISAAMKRKERESKKITDKLEEMRNNYSEIARQMETARAQGESQANEIKKRLKCLTIAMRIMSGDEVPIQDRQFLVENDPELYGRALMMRMQKENPVKHKRISEDEETSENSGNPETAGNPTGEIQEVSVNTDTSASADGAPPQPSEPAQPSESAE